MKLDFNAIKKKKSTTELLNFGVINIDKPTGPTSFAISQFVKETLKINKTSHMGTLDPMVTGVLPITLGRACKLADYFMHRDKEYVGIMRLHEDVSDVDLQKAIAPFLGKITQMPPLRSRVKRQLREREIKGFSIIEREEKDIVFVSDVEAGTYIRKLIHDMGEGIGGAHMLELRRIRAGIFEEGEECMRLYDFEKAVQAYKKGDDKELRAMIIPAEEVLCSYMESVQVKKSALPKLYTGKPIYSQDLEGKEIGETGDFIAVFNGQTFIEVAEIVKRGDFYAKASFVFN